MSDPKGSNPPGGWIFEASLVRVADLDAAGRAAFSNIGMDTLASGRVGEEEENDNGEVKIEVNGAMPSMTYGVEFCSFAGGMGSCSSLGSLMTDQNGNAEARLQFPQGVMAGVFVLTRNNQDQFVSGVMVGADGRSQAQGAEGDGEGFQAGLQRVSMVNGGLGANFGAAGSDALTSGRVEVESEGEQDDENENEGPVEVKVAGAAANMTFALEFCRFGAGPGGCVAVGSFTTDMMGNAEGEFAFPLSGTFDGIFIVTRNVNGQAQNEFVTAFVR
jgi:hypothetical protein